MSPRLAAFEMAGFAETNPPISLRLPRGKGMADDKLLVKHVSGVKTICGGIEYGVFRV